LTTQFFIPLANSKLAASSEIYLFYEANAVKFYKDCSNFPHGVAMHFSIRFSRDLVVESVLSECAPPLQKYDDATLLFNQP
jgi:hypothetical protein